MTAGAQQTIPTDIPLHHAGCGPHTAPACLSLLRGPRGETLGVGMAPGWRRGAITDCPGASHSFNIQANPKCRDQGPHFPSLRPHPLGGLRLIWGLLAPQASPRNSTGRSRRAVRMWNSQQEAASRRQRCESPQPPAEFAPGFSRAAQLWPGGSEW